jgi:hypothetical protein
MCVIFIVNRMGRADLNWETPFKWMHGYDPDLSVCLLCHFWQPVYYALDEHDISQFPKEAKGRFVGFSEKVGHSLTFQVLDLSSGAILNCSRLRPADGEEGQEPNLRADMEPNTSDEPEFKLEALHADNPNCAGDIPVFSTEDLIGRTFLMPPQENLEHYQAKIVKELERMDNELEQDPIHRKFLLKLGPDKYEEIKTYNEILEMIENNEINDFCGESM